MEMETSRTFPAVQEELERQLFHLKTLYDVSREMLGTVGVEQILKNFLLMTTGNFGVLEGFLMIWDMPSRENSHFASVGLKKGIRQELEETGRQVLSQAEEDGLGNGAVIWKSGKLPPNIVCALPFQVNDSCSGLMGLGPKIVGDPYSDGDKNLLITLVNNLSIVLKNARYAEALEEAYAEVSSMNRAKDKVIHHLSHELKTPMALLKGSLKSLEKHLVSVPEEKWKKPLQRAIRNVDRLSEIQDEVDDIIKEEEPTPGRLLNSLLDQCTDHLEMLFTEEVGEGGAVERIRNRIQEIFGPRESAAESIQLDLFVAVKLEELRPDFAHREVQVVPNLNQHAIVTIPREPLEKVVKGLLKNAIENTPDEGKIEVALEQRPDGVFLMVRDTGVGIIEEHQKRIFEGFFPTQDTMNYSSRKPFDFNAGGKGADLLRMKIFSERFNFKLDMASTRCRFIPKESDICPGRISRCIPCRSPNDCYHSGGSTFSVVFPNSSNPEAEQEL